MSASHIIKILDCPAAIPEAKDQTFIPIPAPEKDAPVVKIAILQAGILRMMSSFFCDARDLEPTFWPNIPDFCFSRFAY